MSGSLKTMKSLRSSKKPSFYARQVNKMKIIEESSFQKPTIQQILKSYQHKKEYISKIKNIFMRSQKNQQPLFYSEKPNQEQKTKHTDILNTSQQTTLNKTKTSVFRQTATHSCQKNLETFNKIKVNLKSSKTKFRVSSNKHRYNSSNMLQIQWYSKQNQLIKEKFRIEKMLPVLESRKINVKQRNKKISNTDISINNIIQNKDLPVTVQQKLTKRYIDIQMAQLMYDDDQYPKIKEYSPRTILKISKMRSRAKTQVSPIGLSGWVNQQQRTLLF